MDNLSYRKVCKTWSQYIPLPLKERTRIYLRQQLTKSFPISIGDTPFIRKIIGDDLSLLICLDNPEIDSKKIPDLASFFDIITEHRAINYFSLLLEGKLGRYDWSFSSLTHPAIIEKIFTSDNKQLRNIIFSEYIKFIDASGDEFLPVNEFIIRAAQEFKYEFVYDDKVISSFIYEEGLLPILKDVLENHGICGRKINLSTLCDWHTNLSDDKEVVSLIARIINEYYQEIQVSGYDNELYKLYRKCIRSLKPHLLPEVLSFYQDKLRRK